MPELPEVETTVNGLRSKVIGLSFFDVYSDTKKLIKNTSFKTFQKTIKGKKIIKVWRRGKNIIMDLSGGYSILVHLKMTGHLLYGTYQKKKDKWISIDKGPLSADKFNGYIRLIFLFNNKQMLALSDLRKFALVELHKTKDLDQRFSYLGPEPFKITFKTFKDILTGQRGKIKQVLLNQNVLVGIGNIYADEILWKTKIHPKRTIDSLKEKELKDIYSSMKTIFKKSIKFQGTSSSDYRGILGERGSFQDYLKAYKRDNKECFRCKTKIIKEKIAGRGTHFCPECQKL